jgi:hypothetical protein
MKKTLLLILTGIYFNVHSQLYNAGTLFEVYYDVNPDTLLNYNVTPYTNETFGLNLFGEPSDDIQFTARGAVSSSGSSAYISVTSFNPNLYLLFGRWDSVFVVGTSTWDVTKIAKPLLVTEPIDAPDAIWETGTLYLTDHSGHSGGNKTVNDFVGLEKFIGIKYENNGSFSYGWIRVKCPGEDSCFVKDLSYSQISIGIDEKGEGSVQVFPNPSKGNFYINNTDITSFDAAKLSLTNMYGQKINFSYEFKGLDIKIITEDNLAQGCYFLKYNSDSRNFSKKLIKSTDE